jgi:hypothetical protein
MATQNPPKGKPSLNVPKVAGKTLEEIKACTLTCQRCQGSSSVSGKPGASTDASRDPIRLRHGKQINRPAAISSIRGSAVAHGRAIPTQRSNSRRILPTIWSTTAHLGVLANEDETCFASARTGDIHRDQTDGAGNIGTQSLGDGNRRSIGADNSLPGRTHRS